MPDGSVRVEPEWNKAEPNQTMIVAAGYVGRQRGNGGSGGSGGRSEARAKTEVMHAEAIRRWSSVGERRNMPVLTVWGETVQRPIAAKQVFGEARTCRGRCDLCGPQEGASAGR